LLLCATALCAAAVLLSVAASSAGAGGPTFALKPVSAAKRGGYSVKRGYFVFAGKPGETLHGEVRVLDVGNVSGRTSLYEVDATTGQTSGAVYLSRQGPRRDVGRWIALRKGPVKLAPGKSQMVPFAVRVPRGASSGQHLGGIVAQRSTSSARGAEGGGKHSFQVKIQELSVIAVQVDLPGPQRVRMTLTGIRAGGQPGHQALLLGIGNAGNVLLKGRGSLRVVEQSGRRVQSRRFGLDTFVSHTHIDFPVYVQGKALPPGRYRGTITIHYRGHRLTRTFPFTISAAQVRQVFGSPAAAHSASGSSSNETLLHAMIGVSALSVGAAGFFFLRSRGFF
jgi:hypothetical protein